MYELKPRQQIRRRPPQTGNTFWRGVITGVLAFVAAVTFAMSGALIGYAIIANALPQPDELAEKITPFQSSLKIVDRHGKLLNEAFDIDKGRHEKVALADIPLYAQQATIDTEDANFYDHGGVDPIALARAVYYATQEGDFVSGGSTIPQQLVKMKFLTPEQTISRKIKEAILSTEVSRLYEKEEILEIYLNELYYGNFAFGISTAAKTYLGKDVRTLTLGEAAFLAGLPQAPAYYDPYTQPDRAKKRQGIVLGLMVKAGHISQAEADAAWQENLQFVPLNFDIEAPHFTLFVRQQLEELFTASVIQSGYTVTTTLDSQLQTEAERIVHDQVAALPQHNVSNGALVAIRPETGEILALVGSADFDNVEIDGQVNMALAPRQPGSTIKPLVYLSAFEQPNRPIQERWTQGTLVADIVEAFPDGANPPYVPTNYDNRERGLVTVRTALANSLNIPAVRTIQAVGIANFLPTAQRLGITTLTRPDYGLSLSLGAGEVPLLEMTGAFAVLANDGVRMPPISIMKITDINGEVVCELGTERPCQPGGGLGQQVVNPVDAFLITDILSDNDARSIAFGPNSLLRLDRPAAAKTGTTNDFRDVLTLGYTPQLVTGVWVGNADNSEMINISGITGAAPIWNEFMRTAHAILQAPPMEFTPPPGVRQFEVCADTGTLPSEACPEKRMRWFAEDRPPLPKERDLYQKVRLGNGEERVFKIYPEQYRRWAEDHGIPQPPSDGTIAVPGSATLFIGQPITDETVSGVVTIYGSATAANFANYELRYGISHEPGAFSEPFSGPSSAPVINGVLGQWDTTGLGEGPHTLLLLVRDTTGNQFERRIRLYVGPSAPTETPFETPTVTPEAPTATETPVVPVDTPVPVDTETPTPDPALFTPIPADTPTTAPVVPVDTPLPIDTPIPVDTPVTDATPTWTPEVLPPAESSQPITGSGVVTSSEVVTGSSVVTTVIDNSAITTTTQ